MWRAILIDDEEIALDVMDILLDEVGDVEVVGRFQLVAEALEQCGTLQPDLIFLDIEMPGVSGLEAAGALTACCPDAEIVYVTAHDQYAIDAFDTAAIGYLLKPVAKDKLVKTLSRYADRQAKKHRSGDSMDGNALSVASSAAGLERHAEDKPRLSLKVLGSMELYAPDGRLLTWRTKKTKELFALLWHHRSRPVYKYAILEYLWPDDPAERGQKLLHTSLYYLRSLFKAEGYDGFVNYGDERYWIDPSAIRSDLEELLGMLKEGDAATKAEDMLKLYSGGDYLEMEHYEWANAYRMELRSAMMSFMNAALERVPTDYRMQMLWKLIELEPGRMYYYDLLADCLCQAGDQDGVRRVRAMMEQMELKGE